MSADTMQQQDAPEQQAQPRARTFFFPFPGVVVQLTFVGDNSSAAPNPTLADLAAMLFASSGEGFDPSRFFETNGHFGTPPASAKAVEALPEIDLTESDVESKPSCSVCLEDHIAGTKALRLPCTHLFHKECVMPWLQQHNSCPSCRFELPTDDSQYEARKRQQQSPPAEQHQEQQDGDGSNAEQGTAEGQQQQQPPLRRRRVDDVHGMLKNALHDFLFCYELLLPYELFAVTLLLHLYCYARFFCGKIVSELCCCDL
eukprot:TRINITY_DN2988_c0_g1_i2.p1 TRINITY_DN2988_c0_g1~~TRINITY_DN2988_c0_g1_i2.p1  ORF type:complete len:278 (-),score=38.64 TRINITY_DN2988_c0_g1_i2:53-826(-)